MFIIDIFVTIFTLMLFIGIVVGLIIILYKYLYKRQINNSLQGKRTFGFMEPVNFIFSIFFIILIYFAVSSQIKINNLEDMISNLNNNFNQEIFNNNSRYYDLLYKYEELVEQDKWISEEEFEVLKFTEDKKQANVKISFSIKELKQNARLYLVITNVADNSTVQKVELTDKSILAFSQVVQLDINKNYSVYLLEETEMENRQEKIRITVNLLDKYRHWIVNE